MFGFSINFVLLSAILITGNCYFAVAEGDFTTGTCKTNEVFSPCGSHGCLSTCAEPDLIARCSYRPGCYPGCICEEGFLRDPSGNCIPEENCTCGENETYSDSGKWICENSCAQPKKAEVCKAEAFPGCGCKEGYLRVKEGVCVLPEDCDNGCGGDPNAYFAYCGDPCPETCNNMDKGGLTCLSCLLGGGCRCKEGFVKDSLGKCIKPCDCPKCGPNEVFACGSACDTTCATLGDTCPIINIKCNDKCYCVDGYARDKKNVCIPIKQCPAKRCKAHEVFKNCGTKCQPTCNNRNPICSKECAKGCFCREGYIRQNGVCIPVKNCPKCGAHEVFKECGTRCPPTCDVRNPVCTADCVPGCFCKDGYILQNGTCIPDKQCPKCGTHEVFSECGTQCQPTCNDKNPICAAVCAVGCFCKNGYIRQNGACIPVKKCPKCGAHEVFKECGTRCPPTCSLRYPICTDDCVAGCFCEDGYICQNETCIPEKYCPKKCPKDEVYSECGNNACYNTCANPHIAPLCKWTCTAGCICAEGLLRNSKGVCVNPVDCDTCKANEVFSPCGNHGCLNTCAEPDLIERCDYAPGCYPGCICDEGFLRDPTGNCIPEENCTCGENEAYSDRGKWICENTCSQPNRSTFCKAPAFPGCGCKEGYLRVKEGLCVDPENCPKCGPNEVFACGSACDTTCATLGDTCPIVNIKCNDKCYCVDGFARDKNNVCIPIKQCPRKL